MKKLIEASIAIMAVVWFCVFLIDIIIANTNSSFALKSVEDIFFNLITPGMLIVTIGYFAYKFTKFQPVTNSMEANGERM